MDLGDSASAMPIQSQVLVIKPENQANITRANGSRNLKVYIPPHIGYWLPSQSDFHFNIKMKGRGQPIPSRDAGCHSLILNVRSWDGTGTHLLESVEQYNTFVAQCYNYNKTQALSNDRAEFQGVQANKSLDNNLYWSLAGGTNWAGGVISQPNVARSLQFVSPLKTKLYDTSQYVPVGALGGVRLEIQLDNYLRSLEYTTGSLGVESANGLPAYPLAIMPHAGEYPSPSAGQTPLRNFIYTGFTGANVGESYQTNFSYAFGINTDPVPTAIAGYIKIIGVASEGPLVAPGNLVAQITQNLTGATDGNYGPVATTVAPAGGAGATLNITVAGGVCTAATVAVAGTGYKVNDVLTVANALVGGGGQDLQFTLVAGNIVGVQGDPTQCEILCLGEAGVADGRPVPVAGDILRLEIPAGGGAGPGTPAVKWIQVADGVNCIGRGAVANRHQNIHVPLWSGSGTELCNLALDYEAVGGQSTISPPGTGTDGVPPGGAGDDFGSNPVSTLRNPRRDVARKASAEYNSVGCFPTTIMPFSVGDSIYMEHLVAPALGANEVLVGVLDQIDEYKYLTYAGAAVDSEMPRLLIRPTVAQLQAAPATGGANVNYSVGSALFGPDTPVAGNGEYAYTRLKLGQRIYTKAAHRILGWTPAGIAAGDGPDNAALINAAHEEVDFEISDFQYQLKQVMMPDKQAKEMEEAAMSERGLQIDLETIATRQVNLAAIQGPTSQLISLPNISRGLGCLSVPLNQNEQRGLEYSSLRGHPNNCSDYQWELGIKGLCPNRPVPVEKASYNNPLVQSQEVNEKMKAMDSFGVPVSNLNNVGMNWSVGRQFARPQQYFNLRAAGDLILKMQFNTAQTFPKLFVHFINHLRSINISKNGIQIMN